MPGPQGPSGYGEGILGPPGPQVYIQIASIILAIFEDEFSTA